MNLMVIMLGVVNIDEAIRKKGADKSAPFSKCGGEIGIYYSQARTLRAIAFSHLRHGQCAFASLR